ncbi:Cache 3/Cache 2 fusion domain-containing protein [Vibrio cidicii]|uniref:methyl-accepting chemotaxis protein n=1 Tax=Vibrio cidicii TaxID=1763883 RepID=UPI003F50E4D0
MEWLRQQALGTQLKVVIFFVLSLTSVMMGATTYYRASQTLVAQSVADAQSQLAMLSIQLSDQYQGYLLQAKRFNSVLLDSYLPNLTQSSTLQELGQSQYAELLSDGQPLTANFEPFDRFTAATGAVATLFAPTQKGDFVRIATSLRDHNQERAFATRLGREHPAFKNILSHRAYQAVVSLFGSRYLTYYHPVLQGNKVVAISFVGLPLDEVMDEVFAGLKNVVWGDTGYTIVLDAAIGHEGRYLLHPNFDETENIQTLVLPDGSRPFSHLFRQEEGVITYPFEMSNGKVDVKHMAFIRVPDWNWMIMGGAFESELGKESHAFLRSLAWQFSVGGIVLFVILTWYINRTFKPLSSLTLALTNLGTGDFTQHFDRDEVTGRNELRLLSHAAKAMTDSMRSMVQSAQHAALEGASSANDIDAMSQEVTQHVSGVKSELTQMISAIDQLSISSQEIASQIEHLSGGILEVESLTQAGTSSLGRGIATVHRVVAEQRALNEKVQGLNSQADRIRSVIHIIGEVAEQTNLLALNAAIEAARAGEAGRGFAVVADEVRSLAAKTQGSISDIERIVTALVLEVSEASTSMHLVTEQGEEMVRQLVTTQSDIKHIGQHMNTSSSQAQSIAATTEEQAQATTSLSEQAAAIDVLSEQVELAVGESKHRANALVETTSTLSAVLAKFRT